MRMRLDQDFNDFIGYLHAREVRFLVVGGYAVAVHGHPRYTGDLDVWIAVEQANAQCLLDALEDFGFGSVGLSVADFAETDRVIQLGYPPLRIDLLTSLDGVEFEACYNRRMEVSLDGTVVPFIALDDLRLNKAASGRPQDLADLAALED
ncbi:MAG: nucleotidyltransferase [Mycobacteriales bacterium]